jgi:hypothetical protein
LHDQKFDKGEQVALFSMIKWSSFRLTKTYEFIFVLDGPEHEALQILKALKKKDPEITIIMLNRWFGEATACDTVPRTLKNPSQLVRSVADQRVKSPPAWAQTPKWRAKTRTRKEGLPSMRIPSAPLKGFVASLTGKAETTVDVYQTELRQFLEWLSQRAGHRGPRCGLAAPRTRPHRTESRMGACGV